jgi:hypothetical protein
MDRTAFVVCLLSLGGALALTWPLLIRLGESLPGNLGDPLLNATILGWNVQWLVGRRSGSFWDAPIFHPHENALAYSEHLIGETLFVWPIFAFTDNALLTYNVAVLLSFPLLGLCSYVWIHSLTGRRDVALVFALALTLSPYRMSAQLSRVQMLWIGWLPLALWAIHRYGETPKRLYLSVVFGSLSLLILSNMYMLFLAPLAVAFVMVFVVVSARGRRTQVGRGLAAAVVMTGLVLSPVIEPYREVDREISLDHDADDTADYSAHLGSYVSAHPTNASLPWVRMEATGDQALYPGLILLLPLIAIVVVGWRRAFEGRERIAVLYTTIAVVALWLSMGPSLRTADGAVLAASPYTWLHEHLPGWSAVRAPGRFGAIVTLALAALGAVVASRLTAGWGANARATLVAGAIAVVGLEALPAESRVEELFAQGRPIDRQLYLWLARQPPSAMFELPASRSMRRDPNSELLHQFATLQHPHRLVNGYSGFNPPLAGLFERPESPFADVARLPEGLSLLRSSGVQFVVIHPHDYADPKFASVLVDEIRCQAGVRAEHRVGDDYIFELEPEKQ